MWASLLEDLRGRGLDTGRPTLFVLDGAKALHAAVTRVWGRNAVIQRCQIYKKRNITAHVPEKHRPELDRRLAEAYRENDYATARASLEGTARWLDRVNPDAASSLREGLEETLMVVQLGILGGVAAHPGDDEPDRECAVGDSSCDRPRDAVARRRHAAAVVRDGPATGRGEVPPGEWYRAIPALLKALVAVVGEQAAGNERDVA